MPLVHVIFSKSSIIAHRSSRVPANQSSIDLKLLGESGCPSIYLYQFYSSTCSIAFSSHFPLFSLVRLAWCCRVVGLLSVSSYCTLHTASHCSLYSRHPQLCRSHSAVSCRVQPRLQRPLSHRQSARLLNSSQLIASRQAVPALSCRCQRAPWLLLLPLRPPPHLSWWRCLPRHPPRRLHQLLQGSVCVPTTLLLVSMTMTFSLLPSSRRGREADHQSLPQLSPPFQLLGEA